VALLEEKRCDQEPAKDEEDVDSEEAAPRRQRMVRGAEVEGDDAKNCDAPYTVECGSLSQFERHAAQF
jgi:hypothetical protein